MFLPSPSRERVLCGLLYLEGELGKFNGTDESPKPLPPALTPTGGDGGGLAEHCTIKNQASISTCTSVLTAKTQARYRLRMPRMPPSTPARNRAKSHRCLDLKRNDRASGEPPTSLPAQRLKFRSATFQSPEASQWRVVYFTPTTL